MNKVQHMKWCMKQTKLTSEISCSTDSCPAHLVEHESDDIQSCLKMKNNSSVGRGGVVKLILLFGLPYISAVTKGCMFGNLQKISLRFSGCFPKLNGTFTQFNGFRDSDKSQKHESGLIKPSPFLSGSKFFLHYYWLYAKKNFAFFQKRAIKVQRGNKLHNHSFTQYIKGFYTK